MPAPKKRGAAVGGAAEAALDIAASFAAKSDKLSTAEKRELTTLRKKSKGRSKRTPSDRARYLYLIQKGMPKVPIPGSAEGGEPSSPPVGEPRDVDPLDRLTKLADLTERGVIDEQEFERLKARILEGM